MDTKKSQRTRYININYRYFHTHCTEKLFTHAYTYINKNGPITVVLKLSPTSFKYPVKVKERYEYYI